MGDRYQEEQRAERGLEEIGRRGREGGLRARGLGTRTASIGVIDGGEAALRGQEG